MIETKILKAWSAGCSRTAVIVAIALFIDLVVIIILIVLSTLIPSPRQNSVNIWIAAFFLFIFLVPVVILILGLWLVKRRLRQVDAVFSPLSLDARSYLWNGRQYHGSFHGRQVDAYFSRGPTLDIYLASLLNTRLGIGLKARFTQALSSGAGITAIDTHDPDLEHLSIYALDVNWGRELLDDPQARSIILQLTAVQPGLEFRNLLLQPEALHFQLAHLNQSSLTTQSLQAWFSALSNLAVIVESLPPPRVTATATPLERKARLSRADLSLPAVGITCAAIITFTVIFVVVLLLVFSLPGG